MSLVRLYPKENLRGEAVVTADKSISHRAVMCGAVAEGVTVVQNLLLSDDCLSTIDCFRKLGIRIEAENGTYKIYGKGLKGLEPYDGVLNAGNSGTTARLLSGILAGQSFESRLDGDNSLRKRPMNRIINPLTLMGAEIKSDNGYCPMNIKGGNLKAIDYSLPIASAQVKSCLIFASLYAKGESRITENGISRDHTERMLSSMGYGIKKESKADSAEIRVNGGGKLKPLHIEVPSDISSAAFLIAAGLITKNSEIIIKKTGLNPTRCGVLDVFKRMGGDIEIINFKDGVEPVGDIIVKSSRLRGTVVGGSEIPLLIDEIPVIAAVSSLAEGRTVIKDAGELKVKESNRIDTVTEMLKNFGADVAKTDDGMVIDGREELKGGRIDSYNDHRIAMTAAILSLVAKGGTEIINGDCCSVSFPEFYQLLESLNGK